MTSYDFKHEGAVVATATWNPPLNQRAGYWLLSPADPFGRRVQTIPQGEVIGEPRDHLAAIVARWVKEDSRS